MPRPLPPIRQTGTTKATAHTGICNRVPQRSRMVSTVIAQGKPNYRGARLNLSSLPLDIWKTKLRNHKDWQLTAFMRYGWPVGYEGSTPPELWHSNHGSADRQAPHVTKYVDKEANLDALAGPFKQQPFSWLRLNPMMTREKKEPGNFRVILDLSFPTGDSVNGHINKNLLEGAPYKLHLPTALDFANIITKKGKGALLFKLDLARAYRQLPSDPWDWPLLGISWDDHFYFDRAIPFGVRHGAMACQRVSEALCHVAKQEMDTDSLGYIDDTAAASLPDLKLAIAQYTHFRGTVDTLGLQLAPDKCVEPTTCLSWIGVTYDTVNQTMRIDDMKVLETLEACTAAIGADTITKSALQSLMGRLNHATKLTPHACIFLNKGFHLLRASNPHHIPLDPGFKQDLQWFLDFLVLYNGIAMIRPFDSHSCTLEVDACLVGGGGVFLKKGYFYYTFPPEISELMLHISALECLNVLVAIRVWQASLSGRTIMVNCDNAATVQALATGKSACPAMTDVLRELWAICSLKDITLLSSHKPGEQMDTPDLLSRAYKSEANWRKLTTFREATDLQWYPVPPQALHYPSCHWDKPQATVLFTPRFK